MQSEKLDKSSISESISLNPLVFECSWEVCNKVGGINTVVRSKAKYMVDYYKDNYFLVGPYFVNKASGEFQEELPNDVLKITFAILDKEGIKCRFGKWLIHGNPNVILIDFTEYSKNKNIIKTELWDKYKIDSLKTQYFDFDEPVVWSYSVGRLIEEFQKQLCISKNFSDHPDNHPDKDQNKKDPKIVAQFHEWLAGAGLLYIKSRKLKIATVFTTHATVLGRAIASANKDLYSLLGKIDVDKESYELGVNAKFELERSAAINSEVFSTVSEITKLEAEKLIGRKVDFVLPNGLNLEKFPSLDEATINHKNFNHKMKEFLGYYFSPYYSINLHETLIYFLCGRYEFRDKGVDIFIKSLGQLNKKLKEEKSEKTVVAFFWIPGNIRGIKPELLENKSLYIDIRDSVDDNLASIRTEIIHSIVAQKEITIPKIFGEETYNEIKVKTGKFIKKNKTPALSTHDIYDEEKDDIIKTFRAEGLNNSHDDRVKVIFYSIYLTGADGLLDTSYYESMIGADLGIFPSYYEPWGYTPLEAAALRTPSITTDLAGFGKFVEKLYLKDPKSKFKGVYVLKRYNKKDSEVVQELASRLYSFSIMSREDWTKEKLNARSIASEADWKIFAENYKKAHDAAIRKIV